MKSNKVTLNEPIGGIMTDNAIAGEVSLALMCRGRKGINLIEVESSLYKTSEWVVSEQKAKDLVGKNLVLCEDRNAKSYMGGKIIGFLIKRRGSQPRVTFFFERNPTLADFEVGDWPEQNPVHYLL